VKDWEKQSLLASQESRSKVVHQFKRDRGAPSKQFPRSENPEEERATYSAKIKAGYGKEGRTGSCELRKTVGNVSAIARYGKSLESFRTEKLAESYIEGQLGVIENF